MPFLIAAHGGALSEPSWASAIEAACAKAHKHYSEQGRLLEAAVACVQALEDDGRFNAGQGTQPRLDGLTVEMDAAVMSSDDRFGAVVCIQDVRHPVLAALAVHATPHNLIAGQGATDLARALGLERGDQIRPAAPEELTRAATLEGKMMGHPVSIHELLRLWNYPNPMPEALTSCDTVGAVVTDGKAFAVASSTGGLRVTLRGRASDLAFPGGGIFAGEAGAVAVTGNGEILGRHQASRRIHELLAQGVEARAAMRRVAELMPGHIGFGAVCVSADGAAMHSNRDMPWAQAGAIR